ncbi:hypothetical protein ACQCN2_04550 [Brevibacillus ginsengisoli]|uniref:hypothetical protein n=1 Tax=Brevibacillus ginsengisoli TaxID=363854 RepID=UPI003CED6AAE
MQLRKAPILISLLVTMALLFGGWFLYQKVEVEEPIRTEISGMTSATLADLQINKDQILIKLTVTNPDKFPAEYMDLQNYIAQDITNKKVEVDLTNQNPALKQIWMDGTFAFTEALDLREYSKIPQLVSDWKVKNHLDNASTAMDQNNIYVFLKRGSEEYYTIVPRNTTDGEVSARG